MARIRFAGHEYTATPIRLGVDGIWTMRVHQQGPRFVAGEEIRVKASEIIEMSAAEEPAFEIGKDFETAMAEERKRLPSVETMRRRDRLDLAR